MSDELIPIELKYGKPYKFFLEMLSLEDEEKFRAKLLGEDVDAYKINVEALAKYSQKMPEGLFENMPENKSADDKTHFIESFKSPGEAVKSFFNEKTVLKERIAHFAIRGWLIRHSPSNFF